MASLIQAAEQVGVGAGVSSRGASRRTTVRTTALLLLAAVLAACGLLVVPARPADAATTSLLNCQFGKFQMFDVQWSISSGALHVSGIQPPYSAKPTPHALTVNPPNPSPELLDTDYFKFVATGSAPAGEGRVPIGLEQYASNGSLKLRMDDWGIFKAYGPGFLFYLGEGSWGTVVTTTQALEYGSSADLPITRQASPGDPITEAEMLDYQCQGAPLPPPGAVVVTAPSPSMTAGDPVPSLTPTVDPVDGLSGQPTCAVFASGDTSFTQPVTITAESAAGEYVIHCSGAVPAGDYGPVIYVDGKLTVAAGPVPETTTTTTTTLASNDALPSTGQSSTLPLVFAAVALLGLGGALVVLHRTRRPSVTPVYQFRTTEVLPGVDPFAYLVSVTDPGVVPEPVVDEEPVVEDVVAEPVVEGPIVDKPLHWTVAEEPVVVDDVDEQPLFWTVAEEPVSDEPVVEGSIVEEPSFWTAAEESVVAEPVVEEPVIEAEVVAEPVVAEPVVAEPVVAEPMVAEPVIEAEFVAPVLPRAETTSRSAFLERSALERRLAMLEGRTDAHSLAWARSLRAKLDALDG